MNRIVRAFILTSIISQLFAFQQASDQLPQLPNVQNKSQVNTLAKIIVDENGKITIEQITNDLNNESTEKTSLINKEANDVDSESIDEESAPNSSIKTNYELAPDYVAPPLYHKVPSKLYDSHKNINSDNIYPQEIKNLEPSSYYNIYQSPSRRNKLNQRYSFSKTDISNQNNDYSKDLPIMGIETTSEKDFMFEEKNEVKVSTQSMNELPQKVDHSIEKEPLSSTPAVSSVKTKPGDYRPAPSIVNKKIQNQNINNSILSEEIFEDEESELLPPERNLQAFDVSKPSEAFKEQILPKLSKTSSLAELTLDTVSSANYSYSTSEAITISQTKGGYGGGSSSHYQTFTPEKNTTLDSIQVKHGFPHNSEERTIKLKLYKGSGVAGALLGEANNSHKGTTNDKEKFHTYYFTGQNISLTADSVYTWQISFEGSQTTGWISFAGDNPYPGGYGLYASNSTDYDFIFKIHGSGAGNMLSGWVNVANYGAVDAGKFSTAFIVSANIYGTLLYDFPLPLESVSALAVNASHKFEYSLNLDSLKNLPTGEYYVTFSIDSYNEVNESNENNNLWYFTKKISYTGKGQPNLFAYRRTGSMNQVDYDTLTQTINNIYLSIGNDGKEQSNPTGIDYVLSPHDLTKTAVDWKRDSYLGYAFVPRVSRGTFLTTNLESPINLGGLTELPSGEWYLNAVIDRSLNVNEEDDTDNTYTFKKKLPYFNYNGLPDLTLYSDSTNTYSYNSSTQELSLKIHVLNAGDAASGSYNVGWYLSENDYITRYDNLISQNRGSWLNSKTHRAHTDTFDLDLYAAHIPSDTFYVGFIIDSWGEVEEAKENNNHYRWSGSTIIYDSKEYPALGAFGFFGGYNSFNYDEKNAVIKDVYLSIENSGKGAAGSFYVDWYLSYNNTITTDDFYVGSAFLNRLSSGAYADAGFIDSVSLNVEGIPDGTYYLGARVDAEDSVTEIDDWEFVYFNRTIEYKNPGGFLPELVLVNDSTESNYAITDSTIDVNLSIINDGEAPAGGHYIFGAISPDSGYIDWQNSYLMDSWYNMVLDTTDKWQVSTQFNYLNESAQYADSIAGWVSTSIPKGEYYIMLHIDPYNQVAEYNEKNNLLTGRKAISVGDSLTAGLSFYDIDKNFSYQSTVLGGDSSTVNSASTTPIVKDLTFAIANFNTSKKDTVYLDVFLQSTDDVQDNGYPDDFNLYASRYPQYVGYQAFRLGSYGYINVPGESYFVDTVSTFSLSDSSLWSIIPQGTYQLGMRVYSPESDRKKSGNSEDLHYFAKNESYNRSGTPNVTIKVDSIYSKSALGYVAYRYKLSNTGDAPIGFFDLTSYVNNTTGRFYQHDFPYTEYTNDGLGSGYSQSHTSWFYFYSLELFPQYSTYDWNLTNVLPQAYYYFSTHIDGGKDTASKWGSPEATDFYYVPGKGIPNLTGYPFTPNKVMLVDTAKVDSKPPSPKLEYEYTLANNGTAPVFWGYSFMMLFSESQRGEITINDVYDKVDDGDYLQWNYVKRIRPKYKRTIRGTIDLDNTFLTPGEYMLAWAAIDIYNTELTYADNADLFNDKISFGSSTTTVKDVAGKVDLSIFDDSTSLSVVDNKIDDTMTIYNNGNLKANNANVAVYMDYSYAVSAYPIYPTSKDSIRIFFHADRGTGELRDYTDTVFASTSVLVEKSKALRYSKVKPTTRVATNTYELIIGDPHKFYGVSTDSQIVAMTFSFKNSGATLVATEKFGESIHYYLNQDSTDLNLNNGLVGIGDLEILDQASGGGTVTKLNESPPRIEKSDYTLLSDGSLQKPVDWAFPVLASYGDFSTFTIQSDWHSKRPKGLELHAGTEVIASWTHPKKETGGCAKSLEDYLANGLTINASDCTTTTPSFSTGVLNGTFNSSKADSLTLRVTSAWESHGIDFGGAWVGGTAASKTTLHVKVDLDSLDRLSSGIYYPKAYAYNGTKVNGLVIDTTLYNNFLSGQGEIDIVDVGGGGKQNSPPSIAVSNLTIKDNRTTYVPVVVLDLDGDTVNVKIEAEKDSMAVSINTTMDTLKFVPVKDYTGTMRVTFTLSDSTYANIKKNIYVTVTHENRAPVFTSNYLKKVTFLEDGKFVGVLKATDPEYDKLTFTAKSGSDTLTVSVNKDTLTITSMANWFGTGTINAFTTDDENASDTLAMTVTVASVNDAPVVTADKTDLNFDEDTEYKYSVSYSDVENDSINVTATLSKFLNIKLTKNGAGKIDIALKPRPNWNGATQFTFFFSDDITDNSTDDGDTTTVTFTATVNPVNDKPTLIAWESPGEVDSISITANDNQQLLLNWNESRDVDGDTITYFVTMPNQQVLSLSSDSLLVSYIDLASKYWPEQFAILPRITATIKLAVSDGNDTIPATNKDRVVFINRYDYLGIYQAGVPTDFALHENYPNPFNPSTNLRFDLPDVSDVNIVIYNMVGQKIRSFRMNGMSVGYHSLTWDATNDYGEQVSAGVYFYQLQTKEFVKTRKMILLK